MTKLLEQALEAVRRMPPESQDRIARAILRLANGEGLPEPLAAAHRTAVLEGLGQSGRREFVSDDEIEAAFSRFGQ